MCVIVKTRSFYSFTINSQSKFKKFTLFLIHLPRKIRCEIFYNGFFELEILEIFATAYLLKIIIWTRIFLKYFRVLYLKTKKKTFYLKIAWKKRKILKKEKEKWKMRQSQTAINIFLFLLFFYRKVCILLENIFWKLNLFYYICITISSHGRFLEMK